MVNISWLVVVAANVLVADALVARDVTINPLDITAIKNPIITDHTTEVQIDYTTITQTACVITTGFLVEGTKTVTQTIVAYTAQPNPDPSSYTVEYLNGEEHATSTFPIPDTPHATLQPAISFNTDVHDLVNLVPTDNHALYYTADGVAGE